jgi:hypothetical protein
MAWESGLQVGSKIPNIPLNVHNVILSEPEGIALNGPQTMMAGDTFSNLTHDEALNMIRQLSSENHQLKRKHSRC